MDLGLMSEIAKGRRLHARRVALLRVCSLTLFGMLSCASASIFANVGLRNTPLPELDLNQAFPNRVVVLASLPTLQNSNISSEFGWRYTANSGGKNHDGIDIPAQMGSPILAAGTGQVIYAGFARGYGNIVVIDHGNGVTTRYAHAQQILVRVGDYVVQASPIATVGATGNARTPHLHFELRQYQNPINPKALLELDDFVNTGRPQRLTVVSGPRYIRAGARAAASRQPLNKGAGVLYSHDLKASLEAGPRRKMTPKPMYLAKEATRVATRPTTQPQ